MKYSETYQYHQNTHSISQLVIDQQTNGMRSVTKCWIDLVRGNWWVGVTIWTHIHIYNRYDMIRVFVVSYDTHPSRKKTRGGRQYPILSSYISLWSCRLSTHVAYICTYSLPSFVFRFLSLIIIIFFGVFFFFDVYLVDFNERVNLGQHTADTFNCPVLLIQLKCRIRLADLLTLLTATNQ